MRLWSLHPRYLDRQGLLACWRESLLAQAVLDGRTTGYRAHPQLLRFKQCERSAMAMGKYLWGLHCEASSRGYRFDEKRILSPQTPDMLEVRIFVPVGQIAYEWQHLKRKVAQRSPEWLVGLAKIDQPGLHPLFCQIPGDKASWEK